MRGLDRHRDRRGTQCLRFPFRVEDCTWQLTRSTRPLYTVPSFDDLDRTSVFPESVPTGRPPPEQQPGLGPAPQISFVLHLFSELGRSKFSPTTRSRTQQPGSSVASTPGWQMVQPLNTLVAHNFPTGQILLTLHSPLTAEGGEGVREPGVQTTVGRPDGEVGLMRETRP